MTAPIRSQSELLAVERYELYRVITDYEALHEGFVDRVEDLQISRISVDVAGKFTPGHAAKILCTPPIKPLGPISLGKMLKATGMALLLVIDDERFAATKAKLVKRKRPVHPNGSMRRPAWLITREASQKMQVLRNKKLSPRQRKLIAKRAARTRWRRKREPAVEAGPVGGA